MWKMTSNGVKEVKKEEVKEGEVVIKLSYITDVKYIKT